MNDTVVLNHKPIRGFEGVYEIYENGDVVRVDSNRKVKPGVAKIGYAVVSLWKNNHGTTKYIHRMLAEEFLDNPDSLKTVNHIDGNKLNNDLSNLESASYSQNNKHAYDHNLKRVSSKVIANARHLHETSIAKHPEGANAKPIVQVDKHDNVIKHFVSAVDAARSLKLNKSSIYRVLHHKWDSVRGMCFKYEWEVSCNGQSE